MSVNNILVLSILPSNFFCLWLKKILRQSLCLLFSHLISRVTDNCVWFSYLKRSSLCNWLIDQSNVRQKTMYKTHQSLQYGTTWQGESDYRLRATTMYHGKWIFTGPLSPGRKCKCVHGYKRLSVGLPVCLSVCLRVSRNSARWVLIGNSLALIMWLAMFDPKYTNHWYCIHYSSWYFSWDERIMGIGLGSASWVKWQCVYRNVHNQSLRAARMCKYSWDLQSWIISTNILTLESF